MWRFCKFDAFSFFEAVTDAAYSEIDFLCINHSKQPQCFVPWHITPVFSNCSKPKLFCIPILPECNFPIAAALEIQFVLAFIEIEGHQNVGRRFHNLSQNR